MVKQQPDVVEEYEGRVIISEGEEGKGDGGGDKVMCRVSERKEWLHSGKRVRMMKHSLSVSPDQVNI